MPGPVSGPVIVGLSINPSVMWWRTPVASRRPIRNRSHNTTAVDALPSSPATPRASSSATTACWTDARCRASVSHAAASSSSWSPDNVAKSCAASACCAAAR